MVLVGAYAASPHCAANREPDLLIQSGASSSTGKPRRSVHNSARTLV
jgi:hypothetical protein